MAFKMKSIQGQRFSKLTVIKISDIKTKRGRKQWECLCDCGNIILLETCRLTQGQKSCGCYVAEKNRETKTTHGMCHSRLYFSWRCMKSRVLYQRDKEYHNYGGRGIKICNEWLGFINFMNWALINGYKEGLTIDRKDNNGDYNPSNCKWSDQTEQQNNRRNTIFLTFNNQTMSLSKWANQININKEALRARLKRGWTVEETLITPLIIKYSRRKAIKCDI